MKPESSLENRAPAAARTVALAIVLVAFSPVVITAAFIAWVWTRFRGEGGDPCRDCLLQGEGDGIRTMAEAMESVRAVPFRRAMPAAISTAASMLIDLVPAALSTTRLTAGFIYPYPPDFEPVVLSSRDGTPVCGHLALQPADCRRPAMILASGSAAGKNSGWLMTLALEAYYGWGFHVFAVDLRNIGDSGRYSEAPTSWGYRESDDIIAAAEYLQSYETVTTVGVCGTGMAGSAALIAAGRSSCDGPLAGGVVAVGAYAEARAEVERASSFAPLVWRGGWRRGLERFLLLFKTLAGGPRAFFNAGAYTREVACQYYEMTESDLYRKASPLKTMSDVEVPCLLVHASDDSASPVSDVDALLAAAGENPMVDAVVAPSGGHALYGPATSRWLARTLEVFFSYWAVYGPPFDEVGPGGLDSLDIFGNPDN